MKPNEDFSTIPESLFLEFLPWLLSGKQDKVMYDRWIKECAGLPTRAVQVVTKENPEVVKCIFPPMKYSPGTVIGGSVVDAMENLRLLSSRSPGYADKIIKDVITPMTTIGSIPDVDTLMVAAIAAEYGYDIPNAEKLPPMSLSEIMEEISQITAEGKAARAKAEQVELEADPVTEKEGTIEYEEW